MYTVHVYLLVKKNTSVLIFILEGDCLKFSHNENFLIYGITTQECNISTYAVHTSALPHFSTYIYRYKNTAVYIVKPHLSDPCLLEPLIIGTSCCSHFVRVQMRFQFIKILITLTVKLHVDHD